LHDFAWSLQKTVSSAYLFRGVFALQGQTASGLTTRYLVDDLNPTGYSQVVEETANGAASREYTYGLQRIDQDQIINNSWTPGFYGYDGFGTVRQLTNLTGAVTDTFEYDAFGNSITHTGSTPNSYLYRGEQYDSDLGLYYLRARYYNPQSGRFLGRDPEDNRAADPATLHKYIYAEGDPVDIFDPSGRRAEPVQPIEPEPGPEPVPEPEEQPNHAGGLEYAIVLGAVTLTAEVALPVLSEHINCLYKTPASTLGAVARYLGSPQQVVNDWATCSALSSAPNGPPAPEPAPQPQPTQEPPECVSVKRGVTGRNPGALRYDEDGLSTYEDLYKPYPCVIEFKVCYEPPKMSGVFGQVISVSNQNGTFTQEFASGSGIFTPGLGDPVIGSNHWSLSETLPDTRGLLKQLCAGVKF
jgi:RHS repeat-associated protein